MTNCAELLQTASQHVIWKLKKGSLYTYSIPKLLTCAELKSGKYSDLLQAQAYSFS